MMPPDLEYFLTGYLRERLSDVKALQVDDKVPSEYRGEYPLVVVRDDSGPQTSIATYDRSLGITVYMGRPQNVKPCRDLARRIYTLLSSRDTITASGSPIAAVVRDGFNGPYTVSDAQEAAAQYLTVAYSAVGEP